MMTQSCQPGMKIQVLQASPAKGNKFRLFHKRQTSKQNNQVLLLGTNKSGKTTILEHMNRMDFPLDIISLSNDVPMSTCNNFIYEVRNIIFVLDSSKLNMEYLKQLQCTLSQIFANNAQHNCEKLLILLNKTDLVSVVNVQALERYLKLSTFNVEYLVLPTSGKSGYGVTEGMNWLLR